MSLETLAGTLQVTPEALFTWIILITILVIWELIWKAIGLWGAAKAGHLAWFVAILFLNTAGILPIIYILLYPEKRKR